MCSEMDDRAARQRLRSRRDALALIGTAALGVLPVCAAASPDCVVRPPQTEGPFFVDGADARGDIRDGLAGVPLRLAFAVSQARSGVCAPLAGAHVDVWHCDADGRYSRGAAGGARFLRGYQVSDADGRVVFATNYPGWYAGRAVHVHFKIRAEDGARRMREFTSQLYFDDALNARVFARAPYARRGTGVARNAEDFIYRDGGAQLTLAPAALDAGYAATFSVTMVMD